MLGTALLAGIGFSMSLFIATLSFEYGHALGLAKLGAKVGQFDLLGSIESVKAASDIFAPVSGTVVKINQALEDAPELVNESPRDRGWMAWLELDDAAELEKLMTEEQYANFLETLET